MKHTKNQTTRQTLTDLHDAMDRRRPITLTYTDEKGDTTVRTVELHEVITTEGGGIALIVMCRLRGKQRTLILTGVSSYTTHRGRYSLTRPEPTMYEKPEPAPTDDAEALFLYELERDPDDADYRPRVRLAATDTALAA